MQSREDLGQTVTPLHIRLHVKIPWAFNMLSGRAPRLPASLERPNHSSHGAALRRSSRRLKSSRCAAKQPLQVETSHGLIRVAPLELNDLNAASVVLIRSFATSPDSVTVNLRDVGEFLRSYLAADNDCTFFTAKLTLTDTAALQLGRKDLVVGTAAVSVGEDCGDLDAVQFPASAAVIANMAVDQKYRKQGIAGLLLQACEQHALAMGTEYISLVVHKQNTPARGLYESSGFREMPPAKPTGLSGFLRFGSGTEHIVMAKRVSEDFSV